MSSEIFILDADLRRKTATLKIRAKIGVEKSRVNPKKF